MREWANDNIKLKLNPVTCPGVFIQVYPTGLLSTLNDPICVAIAQQLHFKGAFTLTNS